ncbi:hypothetical protein GQ457_04G030060 [Hibiscus cannabinus]
MRNKKGYHIIRPIASEERFSNYYCYYLFWVAVGYYLWKKILSITGYRFHPTDFELLHFYLQNKNLGRDSLVQAIAEVDDICGLEPWQLPGHSNIHSGDQLTVALPIQTTFVLCKLKRKFGKDEVSCIEECQSSHYLPPNLGNYIENNENEAEAARCLTDKADPNKMLEQVEVLDDHEGLEYLVSGWPNTGDSDCLPFDFVKLVAENAIPNHTSVTEIPIEQEVPQDQSGTIEQNSNVGNLVPADERSNQPDIVVDNEGSTMPSNSITDAAEDSVQMDLSNINEQEMDEIFAELEALSEGNRFVQGNSYGEMFDDYQQTPEVFDNPSSINSLSCVGMKESANAHAINLSRKRSRTGYEDLV